MIPLKLIYSQFIFCLISVCKKTTTKKKNQQSDLKIAITGQKSLYYLLTYLTKALENLADDKKLWPITGHFSKRVYISLVKA